MTSNEYENAEFCLCFETISEFIKLINNGKIPSQQKEEYEKRLKYELSIINRLKFATYFLIVENYVNWAKENDCGPCILRGSATGSLVLYCLGLSDIDPVANGLIFERFISPDRLALPDIDIEVPVGCTDKIYEHLEKTYGKGNVAQVANLFSEGAWVGYKPYTITISKSNLADTVPVFFDKNGKLTTQYRALELENYGLLTFDIFESINLSILRDAEKEIPQLKTNEIPFDDKATFELFCNAEIKSLDGFECSDRSMQNLKKFKPESLDDLAIFYATDRLYCEDIISSIINYKDSNTSRESVCDCIKPILQQTYGCFVFQEQLMQAVTAFCDCSLAKANILRGILGKKKKKMYGEYLEEFRKKGLEKGFGKEDCEKLFYNLETVSGKLFLKSHALEFAKTVYKVAYLQANYPQVFENIIQKYEYI